MTESKNFSNENISFTLEQLPNCISKFDLQVSSLACLAAHEKAIKTISKEVSVPGFRKGKAPKDLVLAQYGSYVDKEFKEILLRTATQEAIALSKTHLLKDAHVYLKEYHADPKTGAHIIFETETLPVLPEVNLEDLEIESELPRQISEEEISKRFHDIQMHHATWNLIEDRPAQENDYVTIDLSVIDEPPQQLYHNNRFQLTKEAFPAWLFNLLNGMSASETKEAMSEKDERSAPDEVHTPRLCRITLIEIHQPELPPLDDALAKKVGAESFEDLKAKVILQLTKQAEEETAHILRGRAQKALLQKYTFDLPHSTIKKIEKSCNEEMHHHVHTEACNHEHDEEDKLFHDLVESVKLNFLLDHIKNKFNVPDVSEREIMQHMISQSLASPQRGNLNDKEYMKTLYQNTKRDADLISTLDFIVEKSKKI